MQAKEIRQKYLEFFQSRGHAVIPSASLLPENDSSILFVNSGMSPLVPYLLGESHPEGKRLVDSQKSFRTEDIEEVGDNRHNTFFEMLGNWSLGDYFKEEQLNWWYEFIIEELGLDINRIYQTVYLGDDKIEKDNVSIEILKKIYKKYGVESLEGPETSGPGKYGPGVAVDFSKCRIMAYKDKNWWQRGDAVGELGGPDSETFYDTGKPHDKKFGEHCHLNCDCGRFLEIGNSVFMQYKKTESGWEALQNKNVDFGGGLERIAMVKQGKDNIFETDLFSNIINKIEQLSGKKYRENMAAFEVIADHVKAATFIMGDDKGISPSNVDQGYIVRRLLRRAIRYGKQIGIETGTETWVKEVAKIVAHDYQAVYPEIGRNINFVIDEIKKEEEKFARTLEKGLKILNTEMKAENVVPGKKIEPVDVTPIDGVLGFTPHKITGEWIFNLYQTFGFPIEMSLEEIRKYRDLSKYELENINNEFNEELRKHQELSKTASAGKFKGGLADSSEETTKLHTAAHLLLSALRQVLGEHVTQKGSNITAERLRFDFSHGEKMTDEQKQAAEKLVNDAIQKDLIVSVEEMTVEEAKAKGAMGVFESRYGEKVKVYSVGEGSEIFSKEICGGPHVDRIGKLGKFSIKKEESSSSGVRRIKAVLE